MNFNTFDSSSEFDPSFSEVGGVGAGGPVSPSGLSTGDTVPLRSSVSGPSGVFRVSPDDCLAVAALDTPASNTGCPRTCAFPDWVAFTVPAASGVSLDAVLAWLTPSSGAPSDWVNLERGGMGYRGCFQRGQFRVYYDGSPSMGVHVSLAGQAVRQLEQEFRLFTEAAWLRWFGWIRSLGCSFTRLDMPMDDVGPDGVLDMAVIEAAARSGQLVTLFRRCQKIASDSWELGGSGACEGGETLYFGKRSSELHVCIYDKGSQKGGSIHHIRVEPRFRGANAEYLVARLLEKGFSEVPKILRAYLDFKVSLIDGVATGDSNKSRWDTAPWWVSFLDGCEKGRFSAKPGAVRTLDSVKVWLTRQASQSLAMVFDAIDLECRASGLNVRAVQRRFIWGLVEEGRGRYKSKHRVLLGGYVPSASACLFP